jgi:hypothetical protein
MISTPYLSREEAADYLRVSPRTLARLSIPKINISRRVVYRVDDLTAFAERNRSLPMEVTRERTTATTVASIVRNVSRSAGRNTSADQRHADRMARLRAA